MTEYHAAFSIVSFLIWGAIAYGLSYLVGALTKQKQRDYSMEPESDVDVPKAEEGKEVPVLFGTRRIKGVNVIWYGDIKSEAIKR